MKILTDGRQMHCIVDLIRTINRGIRAAAVLAESLVRTGG
jgi:hypothetical protein